MFVLRRQALRSAGRLGAARSTCRYSTEHHEKPAADHHAGSSNHGHHHSGPVNEPLGIQLYLILALLPTSYAVYHLSRTSPDGKVPGLAKIIESYSYYTEQWTARNSLHTSMIEQAAFDRNLFHSSKGSSHVNLRFPEVFNTGSPHNVTAGQGGNMDKLVAHYEKLNADEEERKAKALAAEGSSK